MVRSPGLVLTLALVTACATGTAPRGSGVVPGGDAAAAPLLDAALSSDSGSPPPPTDAGVPPPAGDATTPPPPPAGDAATPPPPLDAGLPPPPPPPPPDAGPACVPAPETCNARDDDCDGTVDDGLGGAPCDTAPALGECRHGTVACESGELVCLPGEAAAETCTCHDRDCDGVVDDGCRASLYRSYSASAGDHLLSRTEGEGDAVGYAREGAPFQLYTSSAGLAGLAALYRFFGGGHHFASTDFDPGGCVSLGGCSLEGTLGFLATVPTCDSVPLTEGRHPSGDRVYTIDSAEVATLPSQGFTTRVVGHVWR